MQPKIKINREYFNSHARVGRDLFGAWVPDRWIEISTHTPAWGATGRKNFEIRYNDNFNSHARVGRDAWKIKICSVPNNFNSHARVGRDRRSG